MSRLSPGLRAQLACEWEATARKPGNVHPRAGFADMEYVDLLLGAAALRVVLDDAPGRPLGPTIRRAVAETRRLIACNANLGMILLLGPLAAADPFPDLASGLKQVLAGTTVEDAEAVYRAIREAGPGGLGEAAEQDVRERPTLTLTEAMRLAADRDLIARQYANDFAEVFGLALPVIRSGVGHNWPLETVIVHTFLTVLAEHPDTLIRRKRGPEIAVEASRRARGVLDAGFPLTAKAATMRDELDAWLRADGHARNPGSTADLIAAALYVALSDGTIPLPRGSWTFAEETASWLRPPDTPSA